VGERPGTGHATAAWRVGAIWRPEEQRAHHDATDIGSSASVHDAGAGTVVWFGIGSSADVVGGSIVTDKQEQAVLAVVRLIGDQDVEVTAQHASSTSAAVTVRIGALLYLNDQATAAHFRSVQFCDLFWPGPINEPLTTEDLLQVRVQDGVQDGQRRLDAFCCARILISWTRSALAPSCSG
jgi:hypothetical protein